MSFDSKVLLDMATLAEVDSEKVRARKLREAYDHIFNLERRLEIYSAPNEQGERLYLGIGSNDGIGCREETIKMLDKRIESLEDGECRRHCRVRAEMWKEGFQWRNRFPVREYQLWRKQHDKEK